DLGDPHATRRLVEHHCDEPCEHDVLHAPAGEPRGAAGEVPRESSGGVGHSPPPLARPATAPRALRRRSKRAPAAVQAADVSQLLPELYLHGLAQGDFELALRGLLGVGAPLSASSVARLTASWQAEYDTWRRRRLDDLEPVYVWADGIYVK